MTKHLRLWLPGMFGARQSLTFTPLDGVEGYGVRRSRVSQCNAIYSTWPGCFIAELAKSGAERRPEFAAIRTLPALDASTCLDVISGSLRARFCALEQCPQVLWPAVFAHLLPDSAAYRPTVKGLPHAPDLQPTPPLLTMY